MSLERLRYNSIITKFILFALELFPDEEYLTGFFWWCYEQNINHILSVLVANSLYQNNQNTSINANNIQRSTPPRKRPFARSLFHRNQQQSQNAQLSPVEAANGGTDCATRNPRSPSPHRSPRRSNSRRFKSKNGCSNNAGEMTSKYSTSSATSIPPYISPPSQMRHIIHVPKELVFDQVTPDTLPMHMRTFFHCVYSTSYTGATEQ